MTHGPAFVNYLRVSYANYKSHFSLECSQLQPSITALGFLPGIIWRELPQFATIPSSWLHFQFSPKILQRRFLAWETMSETTTTRLNEGERCSPLSGDDCIFPFWSNNSVLLLPPAAKDRTREWTNGEWKKTKMVLVIFLSSFLRFSWWLLSILFSNRIRWELWL